MPDRRLTREEAKLVTRHRLLQAALSLLAEEGPQGLTTVKLAAKAGIAQATFYVHFSGMEDLLTTLAEAEVAALRVSLRQLRLTLAPAGPVDLDVIRDTYRAPLRLLVKQHGAVLQLLLSELHRPQSPLGVAGRALIDDVIRDLVDDMTRLGVAARYTAERIQLMCEGLVMLTIHYGFGLVEGRFQDQEVIIDMLTTMTKGLLQVPTLGEGR